MEIEENLPSNENGSNQEEDSRKAKGGLITMPFIIANEAFEKVASYGLLPNMIFYLMKEYKMGVTKATNVIFYWSAATNFTPLVGAILADSFLGRFLTIALGSIFTLMGMTLLWLTAAIPNVRPPPCDQFTAHCKPATSAQHALLFTSFALMSIGAGGIRPCSLAFGADQLDKNNNNLKNNTNTLESYFGWYYASASVSVLIALTGIVYIQDRIGWEVGFGVPAILMLLSTLLFFLASKLYIKHKSTESFLLARFLQVVVVAYKNRTLSFPTDNSNGYYREKGSSYTSPTNKLRFLNKACIIKNPQEVYSTNRWNLCSIEQVEELKSFLRVAPLWSTGIMPAINISQSSFLLLQANSMDRHIGTSAFQIPAGSFGMFSVLTLTIWIVLYDRAIIPFASKISGRRIHIGAKSRMGIGIFLSGVSMAVSGAVEYVRRKKAVEQGLAMSALWLVPQNCLTGLAEAFSAIGQTEFYYTEFPRSMSSVASSLFGVGMAVANLAASVVLSMVDGATAGGGKGSWVSSNINEGHYGYYYWLLAGLTFLNLFYFFICSWFYGDCVDRVAENGEGVEENLYQFS
ncbi:hypothetical protein ABFS83_09G103500 [Erythranthe nasuta]